MASLNLTLLPLFLLPLLYQFSKAEFLPSTAITEGPCKNALCGEGKCRPDSHNLFGYDCDCYKGWATPKVLNLTVLPSCVIPDCNCDDIIDPPPPNIIPACAIVLCGHGDCVGTDDGGYRCDCHEGSSNVLNLTALACIKDCPPCDIHFGENPSPSTSTSGASGITNKDSNAGWGCSCDMMLLMASLFMTMFIPIIFK